MNLRAENLSLPDDAAAGQGPTLPGRGIIPRRRGNPPTQTGSVQTEYAS
ncbi:hypothetical protein [Streptomyces sp. t39]|nr:hypothetical protein [Streptomyces sp. t39]